MAMEIVKFDEMKKTWFQIAKNHDGKIDPKFELEVHKKLLDLFQAGDFYYYIFNTANAEMEFISEKILPILKLSDVSEFNVKYIFDNVHPDDKDRFILYEQKVTEFFNNLKPEQITKYKVIYDYRLRKTDGTYIWVLMQTVTIQSTDDGAVIRVLGIQTDITHLKTGSVGSGLSFVGLEGEPSFYNVNIHSDLLPPGKDLFSKREKDILRLVLDGKSTLEIAEILNLSRHTVNSHRKSILSKSKCSSLAELGSRSIIEGWI